MAKPNQTTQTNVLFPTGLPTRRWIEFSAQGYSTPVSGAIFTSGEPPCCGMPLGGISTGCLDLDPRGIFGFSSIFNPGSEHAEWKKWYYPRKWPRINPFLGLAIGEQTWVLADASIASGDTVEWCTEPQMQVKPDGIHLTPAFHLPTQRLENVTFIQHIDYWGHYPVADMVFDTSAPIRAEMRGWSPFIPGDLAASNIPAAVFEVHLQNPGTQKQTGKIAFSFNGPDAQEARSLEFTRREVCEDFCGMLVSSHGNVQYLLGVIGENEACFGAGLNKDLLAWSQIAKGLPQPAFRQNEGEVLFDDGSCSIACDFDLEPGEKKIVRFLLAWYAPVVKGATKSWEGLETLGDGHMKTRWAGSDWEGRVHYFTHMYASRFKDAIDVARYMTANHASLLERIQAWQETLYAEQTLPGWLKDALINNLSLIPEDSYWFQPKPPLEDWAFPSGGFGLNESPRGCPHLSCIPCDWYGTLPIVFFFPELQRSTLELFKQYQLENGEIPFAIGKIADLPDMATPEYYWQVSLNGMCYIDLVDRLWQRNGDDEILRHFYDSVKRVNTFTMDLRKGPGGPISMPEIGGMEWFEFGEWAGMATHLGGLRLAELRMVERMADAMGDTGYAETCRAWYKDGSRAMEDEMWTGSYYLNFFEKETGKRSDDVMGYQLDGEWTARYHNLPGVFRPERVSTTLETIRRCNISLAPEVGAVNFARPDGVPLPTGSKVAHYGRFTMFCPEMLVLAMTYIYAGEREFGLEIARKHWETSCLKQGHAWDLPNMVRGDTGERVFGTDYYQNMMLWALPAAVAGQDLKTSCQPNSLIARILAAGKVKE